MNTILTSFFEEYILCSRRLLISGVVWDISVPNLAGLEICRQALAVWKWGTTMWPKLPDPHLDPHYFPGKQSVVWWGVIAFPIHKCVSIIISALSGNLEVLLLPPSVRIPICQYGPFRAFFVVWKLAGNLLLSRSMLSRPPSRLQIFVNSFGSIGTAPVLLEVFLQHPTNNHPLAG